MDDSLGRRLAARFISCMVTGVAAGLILVAPRNTAAQVATFGASNQVIVPSADAMTESLVALSLRYQHAAPDERPALLATLLEVAATRQQLLAALIADEPGEVLRVALPASVRVSLPPAAQADVEEEVEVDGVLEVLVEDRHAGSVTHYTLDTQGHGRLALHFAADPPTLLTGSRVRVRGVKVEENLALGSGSTSVQALSVALPNTFGAQPTVLLLVNFQDKVTQPYTVATARNIAFTTTNNFDLENSFQQTWLTGDVFGWYTIPLSSTVCDTGSIASYAKSAAMAAGVNLSAYTRYVYAFPQNACSWWGLGSVGGNPSQAWINGSLALMVLGHEMGHNFGLYHSNGLDCGDSTIGTSCTAIEYGDSLDIMGQTRAMHFNAFQKERLGWLNYGTSPPLTTVQADGTYWVEPYESQTANAKGLKILKSTDPKTGQSTWYYVEFRQALGFDSPVSGFANVLNGVLVHTGSEASGNSSYLLDMTPADAFSTNPALDVGQSFTDPNTGMTITPLSVSSSGAEVDVTFGPMACVRGNPSVAISPAQSQWVPPGTAVTYTVSVTDNDNAGCTGSTFDLQGSVPSGWVAAFAASALTVNPGASASTTLQVISPTSAADGLYPIVATATNRAETTFFGSRSATCALAAALSVSASTAKPSYTRNQTVSMTASVSAGGSPVAGAAVKFTVTKANGKVVVYNTTTGSTGLAVSSLRLKRQDPVGTYQLRADANVNNVLFGSAMTSFVVQ